MNTVKVKGEDLLAKVRANRDAHRELFLKAQANCRTFIIEELDRMLADAKANRKIRRSIDLVEPRNHTSDYDRTIVMLEMSLDETIILSSISMCAMSGLGPNLMGSLWANMRSVHQFTERQSGTGTTKRRQNFDPGNSPIPGKQAAV